MASQEDTSFARLVSLACHDLRTPLATVHGFAKTLTRIDSIDERTSRFLGMIEAASGQMSELLDDLGLAARVESGRYEPVLREADTLELAREAAARLDTGSVALEGAGATVETDPDAVGRALYHFARCLLRHGALSEVALRVEDAAYTFSPVPESAAPIVLGKDLRDLGAAVGRKSVEALGGTVAVADGELRVELPAPNA
jgi:signal transduction histidine kinase